MNEALRLSKKAFTWGVVATTIAWSVGVAALPLAASAALPSAGSLIKGSLPAVYYYATDGKRYVFPNEKTYKTWYADFANVTTISDSDLASISIGGNVVYRYGTRLVKIQSDPKVYAVEPGGYLRWVSTEAVAIALWGSTWATKVDDVSDAFFTNYKSGSDITSNSYPKGSVVKSGSDYYYIDGTSKRKVTTDGLTANRFFAANIPTTTLDLSSLTNGTDISTGETTITDVAQLASGGGSTTPVGSGLTVAAASDNPSGATIVSDVTTTGQGLIGALKVRFTASADGAVTVTGVKFTRGGISADADIQDAYLYEGDGFDKYINKSGSISSGLVTFSDSAGLFTVAAGSYKDIYFRFDLAKAVASGKTVSFSLAAANVTTSGTGTTVSGSVTGSTFTTAQVDDLGYVGLLNVNPTAAATIDPADNYEVWRFKVVGHDEDMLVKWLKLKNTGSVGASDLQNFKLFYGSDQLGSTIGSMTNNELKFDLSSLTGGGLSVTAGQTKQLSLRADIKGGTNRTFRFTIREATDILAYDTNYNVYVRPIKDGTTGFALIEPNNAGTGVDTTISTGKLTIQRASDSPSTNVPLNGTDVLLAKFNFTAAGEDVKVTSLPINCASGDGTTVLTNWKTLFDGAQVGSTDSSQPCDGATENTFSFGNSFVVPAGSTKVLQVKGDLTAATVAANDTLTINIETGSANAEGRTSLTSISTTSATGNTVTVKTGAITASEDASFTDRTSSNPTGVLGALGVNIGQFVVTGGGEDSDISQIVMTDAVTGGNTLADTFQNLKLWVQDGSSWTQVGQTFGSLTDTAATTYTFTPSTAIRVAAGGTKVFKSTADIKTNGTIITADGVIYPSSISATGVSTGADTSDTNGTGGELQNAHIVSNGNLQVYPDSSTPIHATQVLGSTAQELARFTFKADQNEDINVTKVIIADIISGMGGAGASSGTLKNLKLIDATSGTQYGGTVASMDSTVATGSTVAPVAVFDNISNLAVTKNNSVSVKVVADFATYTDAGISSSTHKIAILPSYMGAYDGNGAATSTPQTSYSVIATGKDSGFAITGCWLDFNGSSTESLTDTYVLGNYQDIFRTKITVAKAADAPSGLTSGSTEQTGAKFVVTNSSNVDNQVATVKLMNLDIGSTISNTAARAIKIYKDSVTTGNIVASTTTPCFGTASTICAFGATGFADAGFTDTDVSAGSSRTFIVTMDTSDATTQKNLTVGLATTATYASRFPLLWSDGVTSSVTMVDSLPVSGNTLSY